MVAAGRSSRQEIGPVDLYAATSAAAWAPDTQNTTRALNAGTTALPGQAGNAAPNARGPQVHQPAQATAAASGAPVSAPQGFTASGPAASQQIPQPTVPYEAAYTPPSQLQQHRQAPAGSNTGQVVQPGVTAVIGAAVVTQTLRPDSTASNSIIPPQSAINGQSGAPYARQATSSVQVVQPFHSAPMHSQLLGRQASGTSR